MNVLRSKHLKMHNGGKINYFCMSKICWCILFSIKMANNKPSNVRMQCAIFRKWFIDCVCAYLEFCPFHHTYLTYTVNGIAIKCRTMHSILLNMKHLEIYCRTKYERHGIQWCKSGQNYEIAFETSFRVKNWLPIKKKRPTQFEALKMGFIVQVDFFFPLTMYSANFSWYYWRQCLARRHRFVCSFPFNSIVQRYT